MPCRNDLSVDRTLIWNTRLPSEKKAKRTSPVFSLMGSDWCLEFVYKNSDSYHHSILLHQMSGGKRLPEIKTLQKPFWVRTCMMDATKPDAEFFQVQKVNILKTSYYIWYMGNDKFKIFQLLPWLYDRPDIKISCQFYGHPISTFQLRIETDNLSYDGTKDKSIQVSTEVPRDIESLSTDFSHLLDKEILADVKVACRGQIFSAHRSVLAARSEVFRAMFQNATLESETGTVKVEDVDAGVLEKLLKFLYSGRPDDLSEDCTADLYEAADKYAVTSLRKACAYWIERNLTVDNCVQYLKMADRHSDGDLKTFITSFVVENPRVMKSDDWLALSKELPVLANEVFQAYVTSTVE